MPSCFTVTFLALTSSLSVGRTVTEAVRASAAGFAATVTSSFPAVPSSTVIQSAVEGSTYSHSTPTAVTVISCGAVSSAPKVNCEGDTSSDASCTPSFSGEHATATNAAAKILPIFFISILR